MPWRSRAASAGATTWRECLSPTASSQISTVTINAADAGELARFYQRLLGYHVAVEEPDWVLLRPPGDGVSLGCQVEAGYVAPRWPAAPDDQQMMMHLEIRVDDLDVATAHALAAGAALADHQPQDDVRVCLDPAGHPFCLCVEA